MGTATGRRKVDGEKNGGEVGHRGVMEGDGKSIIDGSHTWMGQKDFSSLAIIF